MNIPPEILTTFNVQPVVFLGGRLNQHWRVNRAGKTLALRRWHDIHDVTDEQDIRSRVVALGWPVPLDESDVVQWHGFAWSLMSFLPGEPHPQKNSPADQRQRGRLLAEFHQSTANLDLPARPDWRSAQATLNDPDLERVFQAHSNADELRLYLWHLHRARELAHEVNWTAQPLRLVHGDFTPWNLLFQGGQLSGLLDSELSTLRFDSRETERSEKQKKYEGAGMDSESRWRSSFGVFPKMRNVSFFVLRPP